MTFSLIHFEDFFALTPVIAIVTGVNEKTNKQVFGVTLGWCTIQLQIIFDGGAGNTLGLRKS